MISMCYLPSLVIRGKQPVYGVHSRQQAWRLLLQLRTDLNLRYDVRPKLFRPVVNVSHSAKYCESLPVKNGTEGCILLVFPSTSLDARMVCIYCSFDIRMDTKSINLYIHYADQKIEITGE